MTTNLPKWLDSGCHLEVEFAQLTGLCVSTFDPLLQARLVYIAQSTRTGTRRYQWRRARLRLTVTYTTDIDWKRRQRHVWSMLNTKRWRQRASVMTYDHLLKQVIHSGFIYILLHHTTIQTKNNLVKGCRDSFHSSHANSQPLDKPFHHMYVTALKASLISHCFVITSVSIIQLRQ